MGRIKLDNLIAAEEEKLLKLEEKQNDLNRKIKDCKSNIEKYKLMKNNEQFSALSNALDGKGISIEEVMDAISSGNLLSLQEKIKGVDGDIAKAGA
ncbi:hypothetical protein HDR58_09625 [bacterium]|nr:hypothetical protein [bacterium]